MTIFRTEVVITHITKNRIILSLLTAARTRRRHIHDLLLAFHTNNAFLEAKGAQIIITSLRSHSLVINFQIYVVGVDQYRMDTGCFCILLVCFCIQAISIQRAIGCTNIGSMVGASVSPSLLPLPMP
jgi:hypothetical protein